MTISSYSISTVPNEILVLVMQHLDMKDLSIFATICSRFQKLAMKDHSALLGYRDWPYPGQFKHITRTAPNSLNLYFECKNLSTLKNYMYIFYQIVMQLLPKGFNGRFEVSGNGKQTLRDLPIKTALYKSLNGSTKEYLQTTAYNWSLQFEWSSEYSIAIQFHMIGVIKKTIHEPSSLGEKSCISYGLPGHMLGEHYKNVPLSQMSELQTIMSVLFRQSVSAQKK